eukprot:CAMPEP_0179249828 /NCGR_PEP_ID=MMETSP0797-20121207/20849_1 /TAXON_ID=47934 /ORGANISM="Dinophysis acuminata, Strain DAEP01" /LENGTH=294 /DNA_ID=CAMNT_0020957537 /DNA_START=93 /DNA_END=977 /DNA_ORIENTATION=-
MNSALAVLMLLAGAAHSASGQFLRLSFQGSVQKGSGAWASSSSFMSSSSWFSGSDGQIHEEVSQVRSEAVSDGVTTERTQSKVACADGLCQQQTLHAMQPGQSYEVPAAVRSILGRMFAPGPLGGGAAPSLRGFAHPAERPAAPLVAVIVRAAPPPMLSPAPAMRDTDAAGMLLALLTLSSFAGLNLLAFCVYLVSKRHGQADARERSLAGLAEPLAPSQAMETPLAPAPGAQAAATKSNAKDSVPTTNIATKAFLLRVYQRALSVPSKDIGIGTRALKTYMLSVYSRTATRAE